MPKPLPLQAADATGVPDSNAGRAVADDLAQDLADLAADYLAVGEPGLKAATA
ncbi:hypothetical protein ABTZ03_30770 [Kitasatospora sp. NPDC096077]|uniref:hypothetical protein n=1 Tax=Kitasatospora sp. NPDC096077 TaxID=3155544 RepID=UPI00331A0301